MIILTIIAFVVIFSLLVLVHEWGHFAMARRAGIQVEEFGIGLPPRAKVFYKDREGTVYSFNWIPFGGFVRLRGEDTSDPKTLKDKKSFAGKTMSRRAAVIVAGVVMNFFLAWILITVGFTVGMRPFLVTQNDLQQAIDAGLAQTQPVLYVHEVKKTSAAEEAGLKKGDMITTVNEKSAPPSETFKDVLRSGEANQFTVVRKGKELILEVTPNEEGVLGVLISNEQFVTDLGKVRHPFYVAPFYAAKEVGRFSVLTVQMLGRVVVSLVGKLTVPEGVAGPVGIARMTHTFVQQGILALLQFTALISISLGVINIMPFPALDGGRLLFIIFEIILRRRPSPKWETAIHTFGFGLLMLLIFAVTWNDIVQLMK